MESLSPSLPSMKIISRKLRSTVYASSFASQSNASYDEGDDDIFHRSLISADTTWPRWAMLFRGVTDLISEDPATETVEKPKSTGRRHSRGSVNGANCKELAGHPDVDGFLVGGASLKVVILHKHLREDSCLPLPHLETPCSQALTGAHN